MRARIWPWSSGTLLSRWVGGSDHARLQVLTSSLNDFIFTIWDLRNGTGVVYKSTKHDADCCSLRLQVTGAKPLDMGPRSLSGESPRVTIIQRPRIRRIDNLDEIREGLRGMGLESTVVDPGNMTVAEQIAVMTQTDLLIMVHGGAYAQVGERGGGACFRL
jgi:hypothetical protein